MAVSLKHTFQSAKADGPDNTIVQPSDWNDEHVLTLAQGNVLGRASGAGNGAAQELPLAVATDGTTVISTNSSTAALRITQTGSGNALVVEDSANPDSSPFVIDNAGNVISGYTAPVPTTNYAGSAATPSFQNHGASIGTSSLGAYLWNTGATNAPGIILSRSKSTTIGSYSAVASGDQLGTISASGDDGTAFDTAAAITFLADGTPATGSVPGRIEFRTTASGSGSPTERMRIDNQGRVGIGATGLTGYSLRISSQITGGTTAFATAVTGVIQSDVTSAAYNYWSSANTQAASFTLANLYHFGTTQTSVGAGSSITNQYGFHAGSSLTGATNNYGFYGNIADGTGRWNFYANGTAPNYFAGNVGIGTSSPAAKLDVNGTTRSSVFNATGAIYENSATIAADYTIGTGNNAMTAGPVSVNSGVTVTVPSGSTWTIV